MKNEPIIAYDHLQDEPGRQSYGQEAAQEKSRKGWRLMMSPVALIIEVAAIVTLIILMIEEILH